MNLPLQLDELRTGLENAKLEAERLTAHLSDAQLWQRPPDGGWSVGECLAHLNLVGEPYAKKMRTALENALAQGRRGQGPFRLGFLGERFVRSLSVESKRKFKAPKVWQPKSQKDVLERFVRLQDGLLELVRKADGFDLMRITLASPVSPLVRLSLFEAFNLVTAHESRHLAQAARVRETLA